MKDEIIHHQRNIYSPLDYLGDVGGLLDAMIAIGSAFVTLIHYLFGNGLTASLIKQIFKKDNSQSISDKSPQCLLDLLQKRKRLKVNSFKCYRQKKLKEMKLRAEKSIDDELDIIKFIRR